MGKRRRRKQRVAVVRTRLEARGEGSGRAAGEWQRDLVRVAREGREMVGMAGGGGREERNRGGRRRKRRPRERAAAICDCCGRKGGEEEQRGQGWPAACVGKMGKTAARPTIGSSSVAEFGEGCGRGLAVGDNQTDPDEKMENVETSTSVEKRDFSALSAGSFTVAVLLSDMGFLFWSDLFDEMTAKSPMFVIRRHLPIWVFLNYRSYTIASAAHVQGPPKDDKDGPDSPEFVSAVQALKNRLHSDRLVHVLDSTSDVTLALKVFKWASKQTSINRFKEGIKLLRIREDAGGDLDLHLYSYLINCLSTNQQIESAVELIRKITNSGLAPLTNMYMDIVDGFCNIGKFTEAMSFLDEELVLEIELYNTLLKELCSQLIEGLCVAKKIQESAEVFYHFISQAHTGLEAEGLVISEGLKYAE
ncbi:hypothetical protein GW17_00042684 [Ensete ventricosum]|nr:hypothetical protein GW17_00042684 [Ensete ventricosum]